MQSIAKVPGNAEEKEMIRLIDTHSSMLLGMCTLILNDRNTAQDIVQETFIRAWKRHDYLRENEKAWLIRVAVNLCHDYHRSQWWRKIDHRISSETIETTADEVQDAGILDMVNTLPAKEREVIILYFWNNYSAEEIAEVLSISRASVYRRLEKAKKHLKLELEGGWL